MVTHEFYALKNIYTSPNHDLVIIDLELSSSDSNIFNMQALHV